MPKYAIFGTFLLLAWNIYCKWVLAAQNVSKQNDLTWKTKKKNFFFTIDGPAKARATGLLLPAVTQSDLVQPFQNKQCEKGCEIQGGSQKMTVMAWWICVAFSKLLEICAKFS